MPWCPLCKNEYRNGFTTCPECEANLINEPPVFDIAATEYRDTTESWVQLTSAGSDYESDIIQAILESEHIPVLKKEKGAGAYLKVYMGMTNMGTDIFVPASQLEKASDIINKPLDDKIFNQDWLDSSFPNPEHEKPENVTNIWAFIGCIILLSLLLWLIKPH